MIQNYLNKDKKIFVLPKKRKNRMQVYEYLISKFERDKIYNEKEINAIINENHTFNDVCLIRRELVEYKFLTRSNDCSYYKVL